jgi:putative transcriptional regulator
LNPPERRVHHPPSDLLWAYAGGAVSAAESVLLACHLTVCPACRAEVATAEGAVGALVESTVDERVGHLPALDALPAVDAILARLGESGAAGSAPVGEGLPRPFLRRWGPLEGLRWRALGPVARDVRVARLETRAGQERAFVVDFPPGFVVPPHAHDGVERALVLSGAFTVGAGGVGGGAYHPGDVSWTAEPHGAVTIHPEARCCTLFVNDGPMWTGRPIADRVLDWMLLR